MQGQLNDKLEVAHEAYLGSSSSSSTEPCAQLPDSEYKVQSEQTYVCNVNIVYCMKIILNMKFFVLVVTVDREIFVLIIFHVFSFR